MRKLISFRAFNYFNKVAVIDGSILDQEPVLYLYHRFIDEYAEISCL